MMFEESCDTDDWRNGFEVMAIKRIHYILKYILGPQTFEW